MTETSNNEFTGGDSMAAVDVLIVDDEPSVRGFIARVLTRNGYSCRTASDAGEAITEALKHPPALTVSDISMPGKDGTWLLRELKERWQDMSVIMLTANSEAQTAVQCLKDGADDYLVKPVNLDELLIAAERTTERARLLRERQVDRHRLESAKNRTARLRQALDVIDGTYQDTLGAFLKKEEIDGSPDSRASHMRVPEAKTEAPARRVAQLSEGFDAEQTIELPALRVAGKLIGDRASYLEVASAVGRELVDKGGLLYARLWAKQGNEPDLEAVVDAGGSALPGLPHASRAVTTARTQCHEDSAATTVTCPIVIGGVTEGALQLAWAKSKNPYMVAITERLALVLAASLAREHDVRERRRTAEELDLFYKLASASRHSLDLEHVAEFLLGALHRIVDYDVASLLLLDDEPSLNIQTRFSADPAFTDRVRTHILNTLKLTCGVEAGGNLDVRVKELDTNGRSMPEKLRSFVNVPLSVGGSVVGLFHVSSGRDRAFTQEEVLFLHRAADFLASSVQGVRELLDAVKGRIELMVDHMSDGVLMLDRRGKVVAMNGAARRILKCEDEPDKLIDASSLSELLEFNPLTLLEEQRHGARRLVCVAGVAYQAQLSPVLSGDGAMSGAVLAFRNFEEEQRADEMKTELVNVVSHELRTPLTAIRNALFLLQGPRLGELTEKQSHFLDLAQRNADQLIHLINDLLDLSKIEAGKMQIPLEPLSLNGPIEAAVASLTPEAEKKEISLKATIAPDLPAIYGNESSLHRILVNLVGNAIKYTDVGGRVSVEASLTVDETDDASRPGVRVCVSDSGVGIPGDQLESIFDKFQQAQRGEGNPEGIVGTGLGLSITRELIRAHHGRIWAESEEGTGSRFSFVIPLLSEPELFFRTVATELERANEQNAPLVLALAQVRGGDEVQERLGDAAFAELLEELLGSAGNVLRRSGDQMLLRRDEQQLAAILPRTAPEGGRVFETRLLEEMGKSSIARKGIDISVGCAVYPDDANSPEELYRVAEDRARVDVTV